MGSRAENIEVCMGWKVYQERQREGVEERERERVTMKEQGIEWSH